MTPSAAIVYLVFRDDTVCNSKVSPGRLMAPPQRCGGGDIHRILPRR
jgi:hypothetical protein